MQATILSVACLCTSAKLESPFTESHHVWTKSKPSAGSSYFRCLLFVQELLPFHNRSVRSANVIWLLRMISTMPDSPVVRRGASMALLVPLFGGVRTLQQAMQTSACTIQRKAPDGAHRRLKVGRRSRASRTFLQTQSVELSQGPSGRPVFARSNVHRFRQSRLSQPACCFWELGGYIVTCMASRPRLIAKQEADRS